MDDDHNKVIKEGMKDIAANYSYMHAYIIKYKSLCIHTCMVCMLISLALAMLSY